MIQFSEDWFWFFRSIFLLKRPYWFWSLHQFDHIHVLLSIQPVRQPHIQPSILASQLPTLAPTQPATYHHIHPASQPAMYPPCQPTSHLPTLPAIQPPTLAPTHPAIHLSIQLAIHQSTGLSQSMAAPLFVAHTKYSFGLCVPVGKQFQVQSKLVVTLTL